MSALEVGTLVAFLTLDDKDYQSRLSADQKSAETAATSIARSFTSAKDAIGGGLAIAGTTATGLLASLLKVGGGYNALAQQSRAAMSVILGSTSAANAQMDKLFQFTATSPLPKQAFIEAQQTLLGFGVQADKVIPILKAVNDAAVGMAAGVPGVQRITDALARIQSQGKITGDTLQQLASVGIDAAAIIGSSMGKTAAEIKDQISKGSIDAATALDALTQGIEARFGGASAAVKEQFSGAADRVKAAWRDLGSTLSTPLINPTGGGNLVVWLNDAADILRAAIPLATSFTRAFSGQFGSGVSSLHAGLQDVTSWLKDLPQDKIDGIVASLKEIAPVAAGAATALTVLGASKLPILSSLLGSVNPLVAGLIAMAAASPQARSALLDLTGAAEPLVKALGQLVAAGADVVSSLLQSASTIATGLVPVVQGAVAVITPLVQLAAFLADAFSKLPAPVQDAVIAVGLFIALKDPLFGLGNSIAKVATSFIGIGPAASRAGSAILSAFGGPVGLAVAGVSAALGVLFGILGAHEQDIERQKQHVDDLASSLDAATAATTDLTRANEVDLLQKNGTLDQLAKLGIASKDYVSAILGQSDAQQRVIAQSDSLRQSAVSNSAAYQSLSDLLTKAGLSADDFYRALLSGDVDSQKAIIDRYADTVKHAANGADDAATAWADWVQVVKDVQPTFDGISDVMGTLHSETNSVSEAQEQARQKIDAMGSSTASAAVTIDGVNRAEEAYVAQLRSGTTATSDNADAIDAQKAALQGFLTVASQLRSGVTSALVNFVNPADAWEQTVDRVNQKISGSTPRRTPISQDPAVKAADAAVKAGERRKDSTVKSAKAEQDAATKTAKATRDAAIQAAKDDAARAKSAQDAAQKRSDAAKKEADELAKLAAQKRTDADTAQDELDAATFRLRVAEIATARAAAGVANALSPVEKANWQQVYVQAIKDEEAARTAAAQATSDYNAKSVAATTTQKQSEKAAQAQTTAETDLATAKDNTAKASEDSSARQQAADDAYQTARDQADARYQKAVDAATTTLQALRDRQDEVRQSAQDMASGSADAVSGMTDQITPTLQQYLQTLHDQVDAQQQWHDDIITIAKKLGPDMAQELIQAGPQLATVVHQLTTATQPQLDEFASLFPKSTEQGVQAATDELIRAVGGPLVQQGALLGKAQIDAMTTAMQNARTPQDIAAIIQQFGLYMQQAANGSPITFSVGVDVSAADQFLATWATTRATQTAQFFAALGSSGGGGGGGPIALKRARGGPIFGAGTATSDSILARLSNNEHVWSAAEVAGAGGHGAVAELRWRARAGYLYTDPQLPRYAAGGPVGWDGAALPMPTTSPSTAGGPTLQVTNYYPQAEPTSVTLNRALAQMAAMDGL